MMNTAIIGSAVRITLKFNIYLAKKNYIDPLDTETYNAKFGMSMAQLSPRLYNIIFLVYKNKSSQVTMPNN